MANDGWEDVTPHDGWEDVTPAKKSDPFSFGERFKGALADTVDILKAVPNFGGKVPQDEAIRGPVEALAHGVTGAIGSILAIPGAAIKKANDPSSSFDTNYGEIANRLTTHAETDVGQDLSKPIDELFFRAGAPMLGHMGAFPGSNAPKPFAREVPPMKSFGESKLEVPPRSSKETPKSNAEKVVEEATGQTAMSPEEQKLKEQLDKRRPKGAPITIKDKEGNPLVTVKKGTPEDQMARQLNPDYFKGEGEAQSPVIAGQAERLRNYQETTPEIRRADDTLAGMNRELTDPVALEADRIRLEYLRRQHFEQEAAFRAQADKAPVLPEHGMENPDVGTGLPPVAPAERAVRPGQEPVFNKSTEVLYGDSLGQIFRGDPGSEMARLALDRQTEAFDREMTHLQGIGTPEGEPLRPLQDIARKQEQIDRAIQELQDQRTALDKAAEGEKGPGFNGKPISSKGKRSRQRGAIATTEMLHDAANGLRKLWAVAVEKLKSVNIHPAVIRNMFGDPERLAKMDVDEIPGGLVTAVEHFNYPTDVVEAFRDMNEALNHYDEVKNGLVIEPNVKSHYTILRNALKKIASEKVALEKQMNELIPLKDDLQEYYDDLRNASRGTKIKWNRLGRKMNALEDKLNELGMSDTEINTFMSDELVNAGEAAYYIERVINNNPDIMKQAHSILNEGGDVKKTSGNVVKFVPRKERGSINFGIQKAIGDAIDKLKQLKANVGKTEEGSGMQASIIPIEQRPPKTPPTQAQIDKAKSQQKFVDRPGPLRKALEEFDVIRDKETALALAKDAPDISSNFLGKKNLAPGLNFHAAMSNNPVLKYARTLIRDARAYADNFSQTFLSNPKVGLTPIWTKLKNPERVAVMDALQAGDKHKVYIDEKMMDKLGFNEHQRQFVDTFYKANKKMWDDWKAELETLGLRVPEFRPGHFPGLFTGAYKTLVMDGKKVLGVISTDTKAQQAVAQKYIKENMGDKVTFIEQKRRGMAGSASRFYSDIFSGTRDVLKLLAEKDPNFADVKEIIDDAVKQANNKLFNFNVHELHKKGVFGNEGNRPWLSPERNANDAFKALVRYFEEGSMHHATQVPHKLLSDVAMAPETQHMPNTLKLLNDYMNVMMNRELSELGSAINTIIDQPFKFVVPTISWGKEGSRHFSAAFGVGPHVPLKVAGSLKNTMSQMFMGWGNYLFTAAQELQPVQTGLPFMQFAASRLNLNPMDVTSAMGRGGTHFMRAFLEDQFKTDFGAEPHMKQAYQYARDRGMLTFSELERAYQGTQGKLSRAKDAAAEANMKFGEWSTRTPMFMAVVDLLHKAGMETKDALPIAENLTQFAMIDYHQWERPMVYQKLGVTGSFMAGLTTFKHGMIGQQVFLGKQAVRPTAGHSRQITPAVMATVSMLVFSGITGSPFYDELDTLVKYLTNKFGGKQQSIRDIALANMPEWLNSGLISNATGMNMQGKFSSADMIPDTATRALSPHLDAIGRILGDAVDVIKNRDQQSVRNLITDAVPSGWRRAAEAAVSRDEDGNLIGRDGLPSVYRTPEDWKKSAIAGVRTQEEAIDRDKLYNQRQTYKADVDRLKEISKEWKRRVLNDNLTDNARDKLQQEYVDRGGDVKELIDLEVSTQRERNLLERDRLQGIPKNLRSIHRFQNYE